MSIDLWILAAILVAATVLFILEIFPPDKTSLLVLGALIVARLISADDAVSGFGNPATITVAAMLALSYGIQRSGATNFLANQIVDLSGDSEKRVLASILVAVGVLSAFINNTAAVSIFLPLTFAVARERHLNPSKLLMPMSFASMFAGTCTLIGTSTNLLVYALARDQLGWEIGMFEITSMGLIFMVVGLAYLMTVGYYLTPARRTTQSLMRDYKLHQFVTEFILTEDSPMIGKHIKETGLREQYGVEVIEIIRGLQRLLPTDEESRLLVGDILLVQVGPHSLVRVQRELPGILLKSLDVEHDLADEGIVLVEAFISPTSRLVESTLKEVNFRRTFNANALAIRSHGRTIREKIGVTRLVAGDSLLIVTTPEQVEVLRTSADFLVLEEVRITPLMRDKAIYATLIFAGVVLAASLNLMSILESSLVGVGLMLLSGCVRLRDLYNHMSWQTIIMLGALIPLGVAMQTSGLAMLLATQISEFLRDYGPIAVLSGFYLLTTLLTSIMSNNATAVLMVPIALLMSEQLGVSAKPFVVAVLFAASASFLTPVGYQTNTFIFGPGGYRFTDYMRVGAPLNLIFWILASIFIPVFWPF